MLTSSTTADAMPSYLGSGLFFSYFSIVGLSGADSSV